MTVDEKGTPTLIGVHFGRVYGTNVNFMMATRLSKYLNFISAITKIPIR